MQKLLLIVISFIAISSNVIVAQDKVLTLNEKIAINNLKDHVMSERKETVANQIKYPLDRCDYFEYNINDKNDFINSFDKIFDSKQIEEFQVSKWEYVYYPMFEYYSLQGEGYIGEFDDSGKMKLTHIAHFCIVLKSIVNVIFLIHFLYNIRHFIKMITMS